MNLLKWIFVTLFILIIIVPVVIYGYVQYQHNSLEKETYSYLIDKGYEGQEILSVESKLKKLSLFTAEVIFEDEPNVIYEYKRDDSKIIQLAPQPPQHDVDEYDFKHIE